MWEQAAFTGRNAASYPGDRTLLECDMKNDLQHQHGGRPERDFARLSVSPIPVLDFSVNLNPLGYPDVVRRNWPSLIERIDGYPTLEGDGLTSYFQGRTGLSEDQILGGNGSTELIYLLPRALGFRRVAIVTPSYHDYTRASVLAGAETAGVPLSPDTGFEIPSADRLAQGLQQADALWLGNPNNPTGTFLPRPLLEELAAGHPGKWIIVDEAFMPFVPEWRDQSLSIPPIAPNVIVVHSLTKFYALAGLRLGAVTASPEVIQRLRRIKEPWTVNGVADALAPLLLQCRGYDIDTHRIVTRERGRLYRAFHAQEDLTVFPSRANFLLCRWEKGPSLTPLLRRFLAKGICVRDCRNFPGLEGGYFRVAVRPKEENDRLLEQLPALLREAK